MEKGNSKSLLEKLHNVLKDTKRLVKEGENETYRYSYIKEAQIAELFKELFEKHKIFFTYDVEILDTQATPKGSQLLTTVKVNYAFHDVETGEKITGTCVGQGSDSTDKGVYKAITGAVKYIFLKTFLIPTGDDPEDEKKKATRTPRKVRGPVDLDKPPFGAGSDDED